MKPGSIALVVAVLAWLLVTVLVGLSERKVDLLKEYGASSLYTDIAPATAVNWLAEDRTAFTCLITSSDPLHLCGFNVQVGDGSEKGDDFSAYSTLRLAVDYRGPAEQLRITYRNAFTEQGIANDSKFHEFAVPILKGVYLYEIPLDNLAVPEWWLNKVGMMPSSEYAKPERSNIIHIGFDIESPMPIGQHYFNVESFVAVEPGLGADRIGIWAGASAVYLLCVGIAYYFMRLRRTLRERSKEMFGLLRRLEQADTESAHFKRLSMYDPLTGLLNRRAAMELVEEFAEHNSLSETALLLLDIDHFKQVNDSYGHDVGDEVLQVLGKHVRSFLRDSDAAVRWGGEEILVICPKTNQQNALRVAEKLRAEVKTLQFSNADLAITASIGVANIFPGDTFEETFRRADEALYEAKNKGRDQVRQAW